jgi:hypothetical protein
MKYKTLLALAALLDMALAQNSALAGNPPNFLPGEVAQRQVAKLTSSIQWYENLSQAEQQARRQGKMVLWIQMLGRMDGAT